MVSGDFAIMSPDLLEALQKLDNLQCFDVSVRHLSTRRIILTGTGCIFLFDSDVVNRFLLRFGDTKALERIFL